MVSQARENSQSNVPEHVSRILTESNRPDLQVQKKSQKTNSTVWTTDTIESVKQQNLSNVFQNFNP